MRLALEDGPKTGRFVAIRFEDFLANPEAVIDAVCSAVDLSYRSDLVPQPHHRMPFATLPTDRKWFPLGQDKWRHHVTTHDAEIIEEECGDIAETLGYGRWDDSPPLSDPVIISRTSKPSNGATPRRSAAPATGEQTDF